MANLTISRDCITTHPASATIADTCPVSLVSSSPARAGVGVHAPAPAGGITLTSVYTYFGDGIGYANVPVAIVQRSDATVLTMSLPCGDMARVWDYGIGIGIQVKSKSHAGIWYEVTSARCQCTRFHYQRTCNHQVAAREAIAVYERWRQSTEQAVVA